MNRPEFANLFTLSRNENELVVCFSHEYPVIDKHGEGVVVSELERTELPGVVMTLDLARKFADALNQALAVETSQPEK